MAELARSGAQEHDDREFLELAAGPPGPGDRKDSLFDLLTALRVVADLDPALCWTDAIARCDEFYPVRARARLP